MAEHVDTLDFFGRLENRLALVATMTEAQGQRLDRLSPFEPVAGELCNEINALRVDVAAAVDELRKLARHVAAVEAVVLPAVALAQQLEAERRKVPADNVVVMRTWPANAAPAVDLSGLPGLRDLAEDRHARGASTTDATPSGKLIRLLLTLRDQGRLVDAQELAQSDLLEQAELQAQALANLANAPALVDLATLDEISARAAAMLGRLRQLVDTDARARQTQAFAALGPLGMAT